MLDDKPLILTIITGIIIFLALRNRFASFNKKAPVKQQKVRAANTPPSNTNRRKFVSQKVTLEQSWKFLTDITEAIMSKFSRSDQKVMLQAGEILAQAGMVYQHVIEYGIRSSVSGRSANINKVKKISSTSAR